MVVGDVKRYAEVNGVSNERTGGFWYGLEWVETTPPKEAGPGERVIYYLHGGGFAMGSASPSFPLTPTTTQGLLQHTFSAGFTHIFASEYRLSSGPPLPPKNPFPACLLDALAGYFYLVNTLKYLPENVILVGDSAGGLLVYQLVRYCVTYRGRGGGGGGEAEGTTPFPIPRGLLLSPSVGCLLRPLPGTSMITNRRSDYLVAWFDKRYGVSALMGKGLVEADLDHSWFSPGSMSDRDRDEEEELKSILRQFPKTMIVTGEAEMTRDCNRVLKDRMEREMGGGWVVYVEVEDAPHDILTSTV